MATADAPEPRRADAGDRERTGPSGSDGGRASSCEPDGASARSATADGRLRLSSRRGRLALAATILGSGAAFVEMTVVNVAIPAIGRDFGLGIAGLQWVLDGYLLTLSALMLLGGSLGDVFRRPIVYAIGLVGFAVTSGLAAISPGPGTLVAARLAQGAAAALLVPNSLAIVDQVFAAEDRGAAIGQWAGWSGVTSALGPLVGGWLVDAASWRWVFAVVIPFAAVAAWLAVRVVPGAGAGAGAGGVRRDTGGAAGGEAANADGGRRRVDVAGAALATFGLAGVIVTLVSGPVVGFASPWIVASGAGGVLALGAFVVVERRVRDPLLPLDIFRSSQFSGANATTLFVYAALGAVFFLLMLELQNALGYSALLAGVALLPINVLLLVLSPVAGRVSQRIGPRWPMTGGSLVAAGGLVLLTRVTPGADYVATVLPALTVFGLGLATLVAPLTAAVLGAVPEHERGVASGVNNAVARLAALLAVAVLPLAAGLGGLQELDGPRLVAGYVRAMWISAGLCAAGAVIAFLTVRQPADVAARPHPSPAQGCAEERGGGQHRRAA